MTKQHRTKTKSIDATETTSQAVDRCEIPGHCDMLSRQSMTSPSASCAIYMFFLPKLEGEIRPYLGTQAERVEQALSVKLSEVFIS